MFDVNQQKIESSKNYLRLGKFDWSWTMVKIVSIKYPRGSRNSGLPAAIPGAKYKLTIYNYHIAITIKIK